ncbi:branched-chain amino acid ABC transporter ATP-binding protein/permease [Roseibium sp. M-1]
MLRDRNVPLFIVAGMVGGTYAILALPSYFVFLATTGVLMAIMVRSLGLLTDQAGLISLCQMTFAAIGAWTVSWLGIHAPGIPYVISLLLGGAAGLVVGFLVGLPALRLRGLNLAAITLTFAVAVDAIFTKTGFPGNESMISFQRPEMLLDERAFLAFCVGVAIIVYLVTSMLTQARIGAMWSAICYSERAAAAMGVSVAGSKLTAFSASAGIAGLVGGLIVSQLGILTASNFSPLASLSLFALAIFAGGRFWEGTLIAGLLTVGVPELLRRFGLPLDLEAVIFAVGAIDALRKKSSLAGGLRKTLKSRRNRRAGTRAVMSDTGSTDEIRETSEGMFGPEAGEDLEISNLIVNYGSVIAVDNFNLTIEPRTIVGLVGPNGAGKSSIIDAVSGFIPGAAGVVRIGGRELVKLPPHQRAKAGIRRTFQQGRAIPELTVGQYMRLSAGSSISNEDIDAILAFLECPPRTALIQDVEIGLRRLIEVAANLAARPKALLLDEPAAGLSSQQSEQLAKHITRIPELFGCSVLIVEHDMDMVRSVCDRITVLDFGKVIAEGKPEVVLAQGNVVEAYLGAA